MTLSLNKKQLETSFEGLKIELPIERFSLSIQSFLRQIENDECLDDKIFVLDRRNLGNYNGYSLEFLFFRVKKVRVQLASQTKSLF